MRERWQTKRKRSLPEAMPTTSKERERDLWTKVFDKALQLRSLPRDSWPKKVEGQTVSFKLINMVEDFYDLDNLPDETETEDLFAEDEEPAKMSCDYMGMQEESSTEPTISMKSVKIRCNRVDCGCGCTCKDNHSDPTNRRVTVSPSPALQVELTNNRTGAAKHDLYLKTICRSRGALPGT